VWCCGPCGDDFDAAVPLNFDWCICGHATCLNCSDFQLGNDNPRCIHCVGVVVGSVVEVEVMQCGPCGGECVDGVVADSDAGRCMTCGVVSLPRVLSEEADTCCGCGVRLQVRFLNACDSCEHLACDSCVREMIFSSGDMWYCPSTPRSLLAPAGTHTRHHSS
jgi:hypothetical protein